MIRRESEILLQPKQVASLWQGAFSGAALNLKCSVSVMCVFQVGSFHTIEPEAIKAQDGDTGINMTLTYSISAGIQKLLFTLSADAALNV